MLKRQINYLFFPWLLIFQPLFFFMFLKTMIYEMKTIFHFISHNEKFFFMFFAVIDFNLYVGEGCTMKTIFPLEKGSRVESY